MMAGHLGQGRERADAVFAHGNDDQQVATLSEASPEPVLAACGPASYQLRLSRQEDKASPGTRPILGGLS
jgi:hypothetical protein